MKIIIFCFMVICSVLPLWSTRTCDGREACLRNQFYTEQKTCVDNTKNKSRGSPYRNLFIDQKQHAVKVAVSRRPTHQIVSRIYGVFLREMMGYQQVTFVERNTFNTYELVKSMSGISENKSSPDPDFVPDVMIDLELWVGPTFNSEEFGSGSQVLDLGPLGPIGRYGWFVPDKVVQQEWSESRTIVDNWRAFTDPIVTEKFSLDDAELVSHSWNEMTDNFFCTRSDCVNGTFVPPQCKKNVTCARLLADYPDYSYDILKAEIMELKLLVKVTWIGYKLEKYALNHKPKSHILIFNYKPNILTSLNNFTYVSFPHCEDRNPVSGVATKCDYEINQMQKVIWHKLRNASQEIYDSIRAISFSQEDYNEILSNYKKTQSKQVSEVTAQQYEAIACEMASEWEDRLHKWVPQELSPKTQLFIGGIFPFSNVYWTQKGAQIAASMAVDAVNRDDNVLSHYQLKMDYEDGQCAPDVVMQKYIGFIGDNNFKYHRLIGILGPACTDALDPLVGVAKHFKTVVITYSAEGSLQGKKYDYFFRTIPGNHLYKHVYMKFFELMNWSKAAALSMEGQKYGDYLSSMSSEFMNENKVNFQHLKFSDDEGIRTNLRLLKKLNYKIIIGDFYDDVARKVMCEAHIENMTAKYGYQWFFPIWLADDWYNISNYNGLYEASPVGHENITCKPDDMLEAINGYMSLGYKYFADNDTIMQENKTVKYWRDFYTEVITKQIKSQPSKYAGFAYDAIWVFAKALDALLKENNTHVDGLHTEPIFTRFQELIKATNFTGVSGRVSFVGSNRLSDVIIWQKQNASFQLIGQYTPTNANGSEGKLNVSTDNIKWYTADGNKITDGIVPPVKDKNSCVLEGLRQLMGISCEVAIIVANLMGFTVFALLMITGFFLFKRKYDEKVKKTEARMRELGLLTSSNLLALDGWEMSREHIVINRKLGEGAFGTVYGGEAFIRDKGWLGVAVKTLKVGATIEEKLDFLSEAEMMKRFDHKNIVRLLGVCTVGEPVYTVMEFMLYGDLKTYLLARRHLVKEQNRNQSDEVSDRCLTAMALDIARGLSYLADLKYVHRDLACRNCLVNAGRTVKIGDFGMCRPMYDSDYYRFTKRGMLPVRWMAPESLNDGIFTTMSDVWSYGVLLYEIVTFASFPYQGLSNNQVLEYVKNFNTLPVPNGCKRELEVLFLRCWSRTSQQRPSASEIVEILATHNSLISPCLDLPLASVVVEDTDSIEIAITERSRLHSISSLGWRATETTAPNENRIPLVAPASPGSPTSNQYVTLGQNRTLADHAFLLNRNDSATSV